MANLYLVQNVPLKRGNPTAQWQSTYFVCSRFNPQHLWLELSLDRMARKKRLLEALEKPITRQGRQHISDSE